MTPSPGTILAGRYRVVRTLGQGGMGTVLEVVHAELGERYALKLLNGESSTDAESLARFANEARVAARLRSEHLVRVTDMGQLPTGEPFLVMDYLEGMDLEHVVSRGPAPIPTAITWVLQACAGLALLHAEGFVHRDIKPSNLFLARERDGRHLVKVLDFGLAKVTGPGAARLTSTRANFGTPAFMAPEQVMSAKNVDARCDQHAIGLVLFELLTGRSAFEGETVGAITVAIATQPAPRVSRFRPDVPPAIDDAVARALAKHPNERFSTLAGLARAIAPFGDAHARALLEMIERTLGPPPPDAVVVAQSASPVDSRRVARGADITAGPTSRRATEERARSTLWFVAGAAVVGIGAGLGLTLFVMRSNGAAGSGTTSPAPIVSDVSAPLSSSAAPPVTPVAQGGETAASAAPSVSAAEPAASASPPVKPKSAPRTPPAPRPSPKGGVLDNYTPGK